MSGCVDSVLCDLVQQGSGNAYAFIRFMNLDMAHAAKVEMSGSYIKNFQCKIGYGKVLPSRCLWVGGLGPWVAMQELEAAFKRYGTLERVEWPTGKNYAYVLFESAEEAAAACTGMRGKALGHSSDNRLRVDFGEPEHIDADSRLTKQVAGANNRASEVVDNRDRAGPTAAPTAHAPPTVATASSVLELVRCLTLVWSGSLVLKKKCFSCTPLPPSGRAGIGREQIAPNSCQSAVAH